MKEVLTGVGESLGGQVMMDLEGLWRRYIAGSKTLEPALKIVDKPASASDETGSAAASALSRMVTIQIKRSPRYGPETIPMVVPAHSLHRI